MTSSPLVSILMPLYNTETFIGEAIDSILNETYPHFELLICNDGSTDNSLEIAEKYAKKDSRVKLFNHTKNSGRVSKVIKFLEKQATGKYQIVSDSDDIVHPNRLQILVDAIESNPQASMVYGKVEAVSADLKTHKHFYKSPFSIFELFKGNYIPDGAYLMNRERYQSIGGINTDILWAEDYQLRLKLSLTGPIIYIPTDHPLYYYRFHDNNWTAKHHNMNEEDAFKNKLLSENIIDINKINATSLSYYEYACLMMISAHSHQSPKSALAINHGSWFSSIKKLRVMLASKKIISGGLSYHQCRKLEVFINQPMDSILSLIKSIQDHNPQEFTN